MTSNSEVASTKSAATIYQFPARGRFAATNHREASPAVIATPAVAAVVGSGWYHDAAIQDAERARKN